MGHVFFAILVKDVSPENARTNCPIRLGGVAASDIGAVKAARDGHALIAMPRMREFN